MYQNDEVIDGESGELERPPDFGAGLRVIDPASMPDLDTADVGISIDPQYWKPNPGESIRAIFNGFSSHLKREPEGMKQVETAVLQTKDRFFMHSGVALLDRLRTIKPGTPIMVTYVGKKKSGGGREVMSFDVKLLRVARPDSAPAIPSPATAPAIPATVPPEKKSDPGTGRPYPPEKLKERIGLRVKKYEGKNIIVTQADRGIVAVKLTGIFGGMEEARHVLTGWLIGKREVKKMTPAEVRAILDWLDCPDFDSVPSEDVSAEAHDAYVVAAQSQPQEEKES